VEVTLLSLSSMDDAPLEVAFSGYLPQTAGASPSAASFAEGQWRDTALRGSLGPRHDHIQTRLQRR